MNQELQTKIETAIIPTEPPTDIPYANLEQDFFAKASEKQNSVISSSSDIAAAERKTVPENINIELRDGLNRLRDSLFDFSKEEIMSIMVTIDRRLEQLGILRSDLDEDVQKLFEDIYEVVEKSEQRQIELLLTIQNTISSEQLGDISLDETRLIEAGVATTEERQRSSDPNIDSLTMVINENGQDQKNKLTMSQLLLGLAMIAISDSIFKSNHMKVLVEDLGQTGSKFILAKLGFPVELQQSFSQEAVTYWLNAADTTKLFDTLYSSFTTEELANFLESINPRDAAALLVGRAFGKESVGQNKHQFNELQTKLLLTRLTNDQLFHMLRRFDAEAIAYFFEYFPKDEASKALRGETFGPKNNFHFSPDQLAEISNSIPDSLRTHPSS